MYRIAKSEADRVLAVLTDLNQKICYLLHLPEQIDDILIQKFDQSYPSISDALSIQRQLEDSWRSSQYEDNDEKNSSVGTEHVALKQMHKNSRALVRKLRALSVSQEAFAQLCDEAQIFQRQTDLKPLRISRRQPNKLPLASVEPQTHPEYAQLVDCIMKLKKVMHRRLMATVEDENCNMTLLHSLTEKCRQLEETRDSLTAQLKQENEEKSRTLHQLDTKCKNLDSQVQSLSEVRTREKQRLESEVSESIALRKKEHEEICLKQQADSVLCDRQHIEIVSKRFDVETRKRKERSRAETTLSGLIAQYDVDMRQLQSKLDELQALKKMEELEYNTLKEHFDLVDEDLARKAEEERILTMVKERNLKECEMIDKYVTRLQSVARRKIALREYEKMKKKKKGGKKKK